MPKYKISCGALVTKLMKRTFTVSANSEEEAIEKAENLFDKACENCRTYTETAQTINIDCVERVK